MIDSKFIGDDFEYKIEILQSVKTSHMYLANNKRLSYFILGLRLLLEHVKLQVAFRNGKKPEELLGLREDEDIDFWAKILQYWHQTLLDDLSLWS